MRSTPYGRPPKLGYKVQITVTYDVLAYSDQEAEEEAFFMLERDMKKGFPVDATFEIIDVDGGEEDMTDEHMREAI